MYSLVRQYTLRYTRTPKRNNKRGPRRAPKRRNRRQNNRPRTRRSPAIGRGSAYVQMISDPCNSTLVPGLYGDSQGFLARFRSTFSNSASSTATSGYFLVVPDYFGSDSTICFSNADPAFHPENTATVKYGFGTGIGDPFCQNTANFEPDAAAQFVASTTAADARILSACVRMTFFGNITQSQGEIAFVQDLPLTALIAGGATNLPMSVNEMFIFSGDSQRLGTDTLEHVFHPDDDSHNFVDGKTGWHDSTGAQTVLSSDQRVKQSKAYGFVWRNTPVAPAQTYASIRNIEWRPEASLGIANPQTKVVGNSSLPAVLSALDRSGPSWTKRVLSSVVSGAGAVAQAAFTATLPAVGNLVGFGANMAARRGAQLLLR